MDGLAQPGLDVYAYTGATVVGAPQTTDINGQAFFSLPAGSYTFLVSLSGSDFWSEPITVPADLSAGVTVSP